MRSIAISCAEGLLLFGALGSAHNDHFWIGGALGTAAIILAYADGRLRLSFPPTSEPQVETGHD